MVKTVKRRNISRKSRIKGHSNKKRGSNKKKSMKIKKIFLRKNGNGSKMSKISKHHRAHSQHVKIHHNRGLHNTRRVRFGGIKKGRQTKQMLGGMVSSPAAGPVGYSWEGGNEATWPGVGASHGIATQGATMSNHFALSPNGIAVGGIEPARSTSDDININNSNMTGGKGRAGRRRKHGNMKGGFFQEIVNLGRGAQYGVNGGYFNLTGKMQPLSQNPYPTDQPISNTSSFVGEIPPDIKEIYKDANNNAAKA
jgi:hypothetical protein